MLNKKLLTLACAAGILVCGACGMFDRPLPPPMRLFVGIHTVRVVVTNKSATHQIDADGVQQAIIKELNMPSNQTHMRAVRAREHSRSAEGWRALVVPSIVLDEIDREGWEAVVGQNKMAL
jgi:hypothetical protein